MFVTKDSLKQFNHKPLYILKIPAYSVEQAAWRDSCLSAIAMTFLAVKQPWQERKVSRFKSPPVWDDELPPDLTLLNAELLS